MIVLMRCLILDSSFGFASLFPRIIWDVWLERRRGVYFFSTFYLSLGIF